MTFSAIVGEMQRMVGLRPLGEALQVIDADGQYFPPVIERTLYSLATDLQWREAVTLQDRKLLRAMGIRT